MPTFTPSPIWKDKDAIIIGGGSSLLGFDFNKLAGRNVIGCNDAYKLGPSISPYCIFGDFGFWRTTLWELEKYAAVGGKVVTCCPSIAHVQCPWLLQMGRIRDGLHEGPVLGWNYSTGAAAINLAYSFGARRVFLLGYDVTKCGSSGKTHWHNHREHRMQADHYERFSRGFTTLHASLQRFPKFKVFNVTDGSSKLPAFDKITFQQFNEMALRWA